MKAKDNFKPIPIQGGFEIPKIKGEVTIELRDVETGEKQVIHKENMRTNAVAEFFRNCGFLNNPGINKNALVENMLTGLMCFDTALPEQATLLHVPAGTMMTANGAVGVTNTTQNPSELGSYITEDTGWQQDGSYVQTYEWMTSQANGTIASLGLCSNHYGAAGEGNCHSKVRFGSKYSIASIGGGTSGDVSPSITGRIFHIDLTDSSCYSFNIEDVTIDTSTVKKGFLRKWRLPISKLNLKGTASAPIKLAETEVTVDEDMLNADILQWQPWDGKLLLWNAPKRTASGYGPNKIWGSDFTQYLWTLTTAGVLTKETVTNSSGISNMQGLCAAYFVGNYCYFPKTYSEQNPSYAYWRQRVDTRTIIVWDRTNDTMTTLTNPYGGDYIIYSYVTDVADFFNMCQNMGWVLHHSTPDGRKIYLNGSSQNYGYIIDLDSSYDKVNPHNASDSYYGRMYPVEGLIYASLNSAALKRDESYIATVFNLETPVVKKNTQSMRIVYRLTFDETEGTNS